jgi:hypothetical protein
MKFDEQPLDELDIPQGWHTLGRRGVLLFNLHEYQHINQFSSGATSQIGTNFVTSGIPSCTSNLCNYHELQSMDKVFSKKLAH